MSDSVLESGQKLATDGIIEFLAKKKASLEWQGDGSSAGGRRKALSDKARKEL